MSKEEYERLAAQGLYVETVGDLIGGHYAPVRAEPVLPPRLADTPEFPKPGIYFGMSDTDYFAVPAFSTSGIKEASVSFQDFWETSWMNPERRERERTDFFDFGSALHCLVLEGEAAYTARYATAIDKADYEDVIESVSQIKAAIVQLGAKPCTKGYDDITRPAKKEDWIAQLLELDGDAPIWDVITQRHAEENADREIISAWLDRQIRIRKHVIDAHPELKSAFVGGYPEVSVFWYCEVTGAPMKARFDYLKMNAIMDLKSFAIKSGKPIRAAINSAIASMLYNVQHAVYVEAANAAKAMIAERGKDAIFAQDESAIEFAERWATKPMDPAFMFVFVKSTKAPVVRGKMMPQGTVYSVTKSRVEEMKRQFVENANTYGAEIWLDIEPVDEVGDEELPIWCTDIGK